MLQSSIDRIQRCLSPHRSLEWALGMAEWMAGISPLPPGLDGLTPRHLASGGALWRAMERRRHELDGLNRQRATAALIAKTQARLATSNQALRVSQQLIRSSAKLIPPAVFDPPAPAPQPLIRHRIKPLAAEGRAAQAISEIGLSLRAYLQEALVMSARTRWQAQQTRHHSRAQRARAQMILQEVAKSRARYPALSRTPA